MPPTHRLALRARALLAALFGVVVIGVVGMHLLSADHELAAPVPQQLSAGSVAGHDHGAILDHATGHDHGATETSPTHDCGDCGEIMMFGSCVLAIVFGVLWRLLAPTGGRSWLIESLTRFSAGSGAGVLALRVASPIGRRLALTHRELSISRT